MISANRPGLSRTSDRPTLPVETALLTVGLGTQASMRSVRMPDAAQTWDKLAATVVVPSPVRAATTPMHRERRPAITLLIAFLRLRISVVKGEDGSRAASPRSRTGRLSARFRRYQGSVRTRVMTALRAAVPAQARIVPRHANPVSRVRRAADRMLRSIE